ncbi:hypothetical protein LIER_26195 [Lithospermum erythrorhizon]|uniref:Uncharacterized protein n=1 Tax=Lithospermum erythrorhizon TaxID=34254 RepID=A0AAV3RAJ1_LITER
MIFLLIESDVSAVFRKMAKLFGGKDPFEDPFFSEPFERLFDWKNEFDGQPSSRKQITIDEINPDGDDTHHAQEATDESKQLVKKNPKKKSTNQGEIYPLISY